MLGTSGFPDTEVEVGTTSPTIFSTIGSAAANDIGNGVDQAWGIRATHQSGVKIFNNEVRNVTVTGNVFSDGIFLEAFRGVSEVNNNIVYNIRNASTTATVGISGIRASHATTGTHSARIYNNFVYGITSGYSSSIVSAIRQVKGIFISGTGGSTSQEYEIANNSVRIDGSGSPNISSTAFEIATTSGPIHRVSNNIFSNFTGAQTAHAAHYARVSTNDTSIGPAGSVSDFNDLFILNTTQGFVGRGTFANYATLANWQAAMSQDANSISADPLFVSADDLHLTGTSPAINAGTTLWPITTDIDNDTRPQGPAYDIGADELVPYTVGGTVSGLVGTGLVLQNNGGDDLTITANGPFTFATALPDLSPYNVTVLTQPTGPAQVCTVTNGTGTISGANVTNVQVTCVTVQWPLNVSLAGSGTGSVSSSPAGISCPGTCSANFDDSTLVTLTPTAGIGSVFAGWSGDCTGMGPCTVNMTVARNVTATFNLLPQVQFAASTFQDDESQSGTITVVRTVDLTSASSVDVTLTDNTATGGAACTSGVGHIDPGTVTLTFGIGIGVQSFNVTLCGDTLTESLETVDLALSNPSNAFIVPPSTATLNINDTANQWRSTTPITINLSTTAPPYPSTITVTGAPTSIGAIRVTLYGK